jgi:SAM-dependent methyltransferase
VTRPSSTGGGRDGEARCPLCSGPSRPRFAKHGVGIRDCERCGHRFADLPAGDDHVARTYGDDYFAGGGAGYRDYLAEGPILRDRGRWYARLLARHAAPGRALDVGCAAGFWLAGLVDAGWSGSGIEPNARMAAHARDVLGLDVRAGALEGLDARAAFDLVSLIQVVAHLRDVRGTLAVAARAVKPGGHLLVETWDRDSLSARWLGRHWHEYSPPSVLHWFSADSLSRLGAELGLVELGRGRPRKRLLAGHAKSLLAHKYGDSGLGRAFLSVVAVVPDSLSLPYPGDDLFWMLFSKPPRAGAGEPVS